MKKVILALLTVALIGISPMVQAQEKRIFDVVLDKESEILKNYHRLPGDRNGEYNYRAQFRYSSDYLNPILFPHEKTLRKYRVYMYNKGNVPTNYRIHTNGNVVAYGNISPGQKKTFRFEAIQSPAALEIEMNSPIINKEDENETIVLTKAFAYLDNLSPPSS